MTESLVEAVQRAADEHPRHARRTLTQAQAERVIEAVVDEVLRVITPGLERSWEGSAAIQMLRKLKP